MLSSLIPVLVELLFLNCKMVDMIAYPPSQTEMTIWETNNQHMLMQMSLKPITWCITVFLAFLLIFKGNVVQRHAVLFVHSQIWIQDIYCLKNPFDSYQGVAMPAMNNMLSKWIPVSERSRSLALVYSGMYLGSVTGLAFSPILIKSFGWPSVFFSFGSLGSIWFAIWLSKASICDICPFSCI